jgi:hypothetical protein
MRSRVLAICLPVFLLFLQLSSALGNEVANPEFENGLVDWETIGLVTIDGNNSALLAEGFDEGQPIYDSILFQGVGLNQGTYRLSFDYKNQLSESLQEQNENAFLDSFFAYLCFSNGLNNFNPTEPGNPVIFLFGMDFAELFGQHGEYIKSSSIEWSHFSTIFTMEFEDVLYSYAIPTFELIDFNFIASDSSVLIDNVSITKVSAIPEPGTLVSLVIGLIGLGIAGKRKLFGNT